MYVSELLDQYFLKLIQYTSQEVNTHLSYLDFEIPTPKDSDLYFMLSDFTQQTPFSSFFNFC